MIIFYKKNSFFFLLIVGHLDIVPIRKNCTIFILYKKKLIYQISLFPTPPFLYLVISNTSYVYITYYYSVDTFRRSNVFLLLIFIHCVIHIPIEFLCTIRTYSVRKFCISMLTDVSFHLIPESFIISYFLATCAYWNKPL